MMWRKNREQNESALILIFSKDRACQLEACLRSLKKTQIDKRVHPATVIFKASSELHSKQYSKLRRLYPTVSFIEESDFQNEVRAEIEKTKYVLFLVDDSIFFGRWSLSRLCHRLNDETSALAVSLRLGQNINYCYPYQTSQKQPESVKLSGKLLKYNWTHSEYDFGYPLEVSSSIYRTEDIRKCLKNLEFSNPNSLEHEMSKQTEMFEQSRPNLLMLKESVAFACPINITQDAQTNNHGLLHPMDADFLAREFESGKQIDLSFTKKFIPNACHQEVDITLKTADYK